MNPRRFLPLSPKRGGLLLVLLLAACQDAPSTGPDVGRPSFDIYEARFGGGNPDLFFSPPLAATPSPDDPTFDVGAANGALRPYLRVCTTNGGNTHEFPDGCTSDVTELVTSSATGLAMTYNASGEVYQVNWRTDQLDEALRYRIEIWGVGFETAERADLLAITFPAGDPLAGRPRWLFGWVDVANSPSVSSCDGTEEQEGFEGFCLINYGQTIPVKVRIEDYVLCPSPETRNCAVQFVASGVDANLEVGEPESSVRLFIPGQTDTDFPLGFEPCTPDEKKAAQDFVAIPTFGPCLKTVTAGFVELGMPAVLSFCLAFSQEDLARQLAFPETQQHLAGVHHFSTGGEPSGEIQSVEAWPNVAPICTGQPTSGGLASNEDPQGFVQFAQAAGKRLLSLFSPEPVLALDLGGGGEGFKLWSYYMLGLPTKFAYVNPGDGFQRGVAGAPYTLWAKATDLGGLPVLNARVDWSVFSPGVGEFLDSVRTGPDGIAQTTVTLSSTEGNNVFHAGGLGIADPREEGCTVAGGDAGVASCNGPRTVAAADPIPYDPFQPKTSAALRGVVPIPEGTFLPFTVYGCRQGRGTPRVPLDGVLSDDGEWDCANSTPFPVKLSGGSTVQATLYWMNDDTDFHIAVRVPGSSRENALRIDWDNNGNAPAPLIGTGLREAGDDVWEFVPPLRALDRFIDVGCSGSSQAGCGSNDDGFGGFMDTSAAFNNSPGGFTTYEISHPLSTVDECKVDSQKVCGSPANDMPIDLRADPTNVRGLFVTLRLGSGAQGNTQWPGFLRYMKVTIQ